MVRAVLALGLTVWISHPLESRGGLIVSEGTCAGPVAISTDLDTLAAANEVATCMRSDPSSVCDSRSILQQRASEGRSGRPGSGSIVSRINEGDGEPRASFAPWTRWAIAVVGLALMVVMVVGVLGGLH